MQYLVNYKFREQSPHSLPFLIVPTTNSGGSQMGLNFVNSLEGFTKLPANCYNHSMVYDGKDTYQNQPREERHGAQPSRVPNGEHPDILYP